MKQNSKFYFIRHGQSLWNVKNLCQGQRDIELSEKGIQEAEEFAEKFASFPVGQICTSPLIRALKTAQIIKKYHPKSGLTIMQEFSERNWGKLEGIPSVDMYRVEQLEEEDPNFMPDPSIESRQNLQSRIQRGLEIAFTLDPEPVIVSHGRLFVSLCQFLGIPILRQVQNLCLIEFSKQFNQWNLKEIKID